MLITGWALLGPFIFIFSVGFLFGATFMWNRYWKGLKILTARTIKIEEDFREVTKELEERIHGRNV